MIDLRCSLLIAAGFAKVPSAVPAEVPFNVGEALQTTSRRAPTSPLIMPAGPTGPLLLHHHHHHHHHAIALLTLPPSTLARGGAFDPHRRGGDRRCDPDALRPRAGDRARRRLKAEQTAAVLCLHCRGRRDDRISNYHAMIANGREVDAVDVKMATCCDAARRARRHGDQRRVEAAATSSYHRRATTPTASRLRRTARSSRLGELSRRSLHGATVPPRRAAGRVRGGLAAFDDVGDQALQPARHPVAASDLVPLCAPQPNPSPPNRSLAAISPDRPTLPPQGRSTLLSNFVTEGINTLVAPPSQCRRRVARRQAQAARRGLTVRRRLLQFLFPIPCPPCPTHLEGRLLCVENDVKHR